jgi:excisionase family DNA binding protein
MADLALTVKEAAQLLGLSERTVYEMCYKREIPFRRVRARGTGKQGKIIISRKALERWLEEGEPERKKKQPKLRLAKG